MHIKEQISCYSWVKDVTWKHQSPNRPHKHRLRREQHYVNLLLMNTCNTPRSSKIFSSVMSIQRCLRSFNLFYLLAMKSSITGWKVILCNYITLHEVNNKIYQSKSAVCLHASYSPLH